MFVIGSMNGKNHRHVTLQLLIFLNSVYDDADIVNTDIVGYVGCGGLLQVDGASCGVFAAITIMHLLTSHEAVGA